MGIITFIAIVILLGAACLYYGVAKMKSKARALSHIPGPEGVFAPAQSIRKGEVWKQWVERHEKYGDLYKQFNLGTPQVVVNSPKLIKDVLVNGNNGYKGEPKFIRPDLFKHYVNIFGISTQNARFEEWRARRTVLNPAFQSQKLMVFNSFITEKALDLVREAKEHAKIEPSVPMEMDGIFTQLTVEVICQVLFGKRPDFESVGGASEIAKGYAVMFHEFVFSYVMGDWWSYVPTPNKFKARNARKKIHALFAPLVKEARDQMKQQQQQQQGQQQPTSSSSSSSSFSLLRVMLSDPTFASDQDVLDELTGLLFAGHDTTAHTLSFCIGAMAQHPEVAQKAYEEVQSVFGNAEEINPSDFTSERLVKLEYMNAFVKETMRMYPIAGGDVAQARVDTELDGYRIPAGTQLMLAFFAMFRDPKLFPDPNTFKPERFLTDHIENYSFIPFAAGAHTCLGQNLAMLETRIVMAVLVKHFTFELPANYKIEADVTYGLTRPLNGMPIIFKPRK